MVPFWRRRLLAVTLPVALACAWCWLLAASHAWSPISLFPNAFSRWSAVNSGLSATSSLIFFCALIVVTILPLARPVHFGRLGTRGLLSIIAGSFFVLIWLQAMISNCILGLDDAFATLLYRRTLPIVGLNATAVLLAGVIWSSVRVRPCELSVRHLGHCASWIGFAGCAVFVPFAANDLQNLPSSSARQWFNATPMQWDAAYLWRAIICGLHLGIGGVIITFFTRQLAIRHAPYHAHHCRRCGYDLLGVEHYACPECDYPIESEQAEHLARLAGQSASNGSQSIASSPTSST